ncbi:MAG: hypothetical protein K2L16_06980 [Muribaculaceae bacterium]|nr:hypothetical protein [Muribaculaceae bacterium]
MKAELEATPAEADSAAAAREDRYDRLVAELVHRRYSIDREIALAANLYAPTEKRSAEYAAYQAYREQCKAEARHIIETEPESIYDHGTDPEEI